MIAPLRSNLKVPMVWLFLWYGCAAFYWVTGSDQPFHLEKALLNGYDAFGRSLLLLCFEASLRSTGFAMVAVLIAVIAALIIASATPLMRPNQRWILESPIQFLIAFPSLLFALGVAAWLGPSQTTVMIALVLGLIPGLSRLLLARARELENREFVEAARALGAPPLRIMTHHLFPHLYPLVSVKLPALLMHSLLAEASLSFLGLGFSAGTESWGTLLSQAKDYLIEAPGISMMVGLPLLLSVWAFDAISKQLEPELP